MLTPYCLVPWRSSFAAMQGSDGPLTNVKRRPVAGLCRMVALVGVSDALALAARFVTPLPLPFNSRLAIGSLAS
jgi:hypothetical protein